MSTPTFTLSQIVAALNEGIEMAADESGCNITDERFTWPYAATLVHLDNPDAPWTHVAVRHDAHRQISREGGEEPVSEDGRTFTRDQVSAAVNWAVDEATDFRRLGACADDIDNFVVNAVLTLLDDPDASFDDVVTECYGEGPDRVSSWLADAV
ncbi:hypothetical protein [Streptomyces sp. NPDC059455]|uniref:hypothetical protein n=1 Tax=Streptomyces sp. NPDC059455 TaxID=3346837 RepID=UPI003681800E